MGSASSLRPPRRLSWNVSADRPQPLLACCTLAIVSVMSTQFRRAGERERLEAVRLHSPAEVTGMRRVRPARVCGGGLLSRTALKGPACAIFNGSAWSMCASSTAAGTIFAGMSAVEIEAHQRADVTWHRPSWRFGMHGSTGYVFADPFGLFEDAGERAGERPAPRPATKAQAMMDVLGLESGFTLVELKSRYKTLAKQHHPDLHGGDKASEERLKLINEAYTYLKDRCLPRLKPGSGRGRTRRRTASLPLAPDPRLLPGVRPNGHNDARKCS